jgi:NTP pyrophosphatase (non-canonical NTP hydrolase)
VDLNTYQQVAIATADPQAFDLEYLIPMIVGETGELFGQVAKAHWHGWEPSVLQDELVSEYGDIAWGTGVLLHVEGVTRVDPYSQHSFPNTWGLPLTGMGELLHKAHNLHTFYGEAPDLTHHIKAEASRLWLALEARSVEVTGMEFDRVLERNIDKLASRARRGVLKGQGDHR